jgi:hypothetical protein
MKRKLSYTEKAARNPGHLPRHYYPGYVFIPKEGYFQARKIGLTGGRVRIDPRFHKTRLLAKEFAQSDAWAKLIRAAFQAVTGIKCKKQSLHGLLIRALQHDEVHYYGSRQLQQGDLSLLEGFNFNANLELAQTCKLDWDDYYDSSVKETGVCLPSFVPEYFLFPPVGITHCRIDLVTMAIDLRNNSYDAAIARTSLIPLKRINIPARELKTPYQTGNDIVNITALGLSCYEQQQNGLLPSPPVVPYRLLAFFDRF